MQTKKFEGLPHDMWWIIVAAPGTDGAFILESSRTLTICPAANEGERLSYALNPMAFAGWRGTRGGRFLPREQIVLIGENRPGSNAWYVEGNLATINGITSPPNGPHRHGKFKSQTLWLDFHVSDQRPRWEAVLHDPWSPYTREPRPLQPTPWDPR